MMFPMISITLTIFMSQCIVIAALDRQSENWPKLYFRKGETAYLPCIPQGNANAYFWKKGDTYDSSEDVASILHGIPDDSSNGKKGKYSIFENGTLAISSITSEDEGRYFCRIVSESNECYASLSVDLIVELEASFLTIEECSPRQSCTIFSEVDSKFNLTCTAYSVPPLTTLRWFNGTKEISASAPVLEEENKDLTFKLSKSIHIVYGISSSLSCKATDIQNNEKTVHVQLETLKETSCKSSSAPLIALVIVIVLFVPVVIIAVITAISLRRKSRDLEKRKTNESVSLTNKDLEEKNSKLQKEKSEIEKKYAKTDEAYKELLSKYVKMEKSLEKCQRNCRSLEMELLDKVTLSCRISPQAKTTLNLVDSDKTILKYGNTSYHFGYIYPKETSQEAVFKSVQNLVQNTIDGKNVFIFAVGGSESGKTFTMYGEYGGTSKNEGLVPRTLDKIFETHGKMKKRGPKLEIKARYIHVCRGIGKGKEKYALVSPDKPKLRCKEENHSFENGLELSIKTYTIASKEDALQLLKGETSKSQEKAASDPEPTEKLHGIFQIAVETKEESKSLYEGTITFAVVRGFEALRECFKKPDKYSTNLSHYLATYVQDDKCRGILLAHITPDNFQESKAILDELHKIKPNIVM